MNPHYAIHDTAAVFSPALIFYKDLIRRNIAAMLELAGSAARLRPHVKTHKTREIVRLQLEAGITKHKCATLAEAEMLAACRVPDVLLAYPLVGPNCGRMAKLVQVYPACRFSVVTDHPVAAKALSDAMATAGRPLDVLIDLDVGQHRTGIAPGAEAAKLYETIATLPGLRPGGLHVYDGHNHQESRCDREAAVTQLLEPVLELRDTLLKRGLPVERIVGGGTPTFPVWARLDLPGLECSPGTCVLHDHGYGSKFNEMKFTPAALLLSRVISRPTPTRLTTDLGYKAIASDPPAGQRLTLLNVPDYKTVLQNEEHLVVESPAAESFAPGAEVYAMPTHICPTCALHRHAYVVENGKVTDRWEIVARDRMLSV
ncbi:threonine aldolase [Planctomycetaceae bacterium SCGC AG-212-F19]|nr:threonine aldolase [Planctomycetaceae bacterium SCGC AG-212-F19]